MNAPASRYYVRQKFKLLKNWYKVCYDPDCLHIVAFAKQKTFKIKDHVIFYTDESCKTVFFSFKAEKILDFHGKNYIYDATDVLLGYIKKDFKASLLRSSWLVYNANDALLANIQERSAPFAILRRIWDLIPYIGEFPIFGRVQFDYIDSNNNVIGTYDRLWSLLDKYNVSFADTAKEILDERIAIASFVILDTLQGR